MFLNFSVLDQQPLFQHTLTVLDQVRAHIGRPRTWGHGLIKHDFTTYDTLGR